MTVAELIRELQDADENAEVRLASQPEWPFEHSIDAVAVADSGEVYEFVRDDDDTWSILDTATGDPVETDLASEEACERWVEKETKDAEGVVYISEGRQIGYLPSVARSAVGWS